MFTKTMLSDDIWWVYMLECATGRHYVGMTTNVALRYRQHLSGHGSRFTRIYKPVRVTGSFPAGNRRQAAAVERRVKRWSVSRKLSFFDRLGNLSALPTFISDPTIDELLKVHSEHANALHEVESRILARIASAAPRLAHVLTQTGQADGNIAAWLCNAATSETGSPIMILNAGEEDRLCMHIIRAIAETDAWPSS